MIAVVLIVAALAVLGRDLLLPAPRRDGVFASRAAAHPLVVGAVAPSRIGLGRLATRSWRATRRRLAAPTGGSVLVVGPTQSGKSSSLVIPALLSWEGPVLAASVKDDLFVATAAWRRGLGEVSVLDPVGAHGPLARRFDPVALASRWSGARSTARALCEPQAETASSDGAFWGQLAAKLLAPLLRAASVAGAPLEAVAGWVDLRTGTEPAGLLLEAGEDEALRWLEASFDREDRQLSSVLATLEAVLAPLLLGEGTSIQPIVPAELLAGSSTLYLCAPAHEQRRHRAVFSAVTQLVLEEAYVRARSEGGTLRHPLLVVLDEAAAIAPLAELDVIAATCASHGITLISCFQDLAQLRARWGERAPTVINNHRSRVVLAGLADPGAAELLGVLAGSARERPPLRRLGAGEPGPERRALIEPHELRQMPPHTAVVVSGGLPPIRARLVPWWRQDQVRDRGPGRTLGYAPAHGGAVDDRRGRGDPRPLRRHRSDQHRRRPRRSRGAAP